MCSRAAAVELSPAGSVRAGARGPFSPRRRVVVVTHRRGRPLSRQLSRQRHFGEGSGVRSRKVGLPKVRDRKHTVQALELGANGLKENEG